MKNPISAISEWLKRLSWPICSACHKRADPLAVRYKQHRTAGRIALCPSCYKAIYAPFSAQEAKADE